MMNGKILFANIYIVRIIGHSLGTAFSDKDHT